MGFLETTETCGYELRVHGPCYDWFTGHRRYATGVKRPGVRREDRPDGLTYVPLTFLAGECGDLRAEDLEGVWSDAWLSVVSGEKRSWVRLTSDLRGVSEWDSEEESDPETCVVEAFAGSVTLSDLLRRLSAEWSAGRDLRASDHAARAGVPPSLRASLSHACRLAEGSEVSGLRLLRLRVLRPEKEEASPGPRRVRFPFRTTKTKTKKLRGGDHDVSDDFEDVVDDAADVNVDGARLSVMLAEALALARAMARRVRRVRRAHRVRRGGRRVGVGGVRGGGVCA